MSTRASFLHRSSFRRSTRSAGPYRPLTGRRSGVGRGPWSRPRAPRRRLRATCRQGLGPQLGVREGRHLVSEFVDGRHEFGQLTNPLTFAGLQNLAKNTHVLMHLTGRYGFFIWAASADLVFYPTLACGGVRASRQQHEALRRSSRTLHRLSRWPRWPPEGRTYF